MLTGLDHTVIVVPDLDGAVAAYTALGFTVTPGGRHSTGTCNALIGLDDGSYLELLAFAEPNPSHRWSPLLRKGGGLADFCAISDDMDSDLARYRGAGITMSEPREMSRTRPDGRTIRWRLSVPPDIAPGTVPFLIEDLTPIEHRRPTATTHGNGVSGIVSVRLVSDELPTTSALYRELLQHPGTDILDGDGKTKGIVFPFGAARIEILARETGSSVHDGHNGYLGGLVVSRAEGAGPIDWKPGDCANVCFMEH
ncbi:MAG: VOC family protein [Proteobacteria bacterium]|nr:MAG: VOC family protein [Pseudomonadota bacterium]